VIAVYHSVQEGRWTTALDTLPDGKTLYSV
jgi:hypothetical protein